MLKQKQPGHTAHFLARLLMGTLANILVLATDQTQPAQPRRHCRYVWGRGALDVKVTVVAMLEAVTILLQQGCGLSAAADSHATMAAQPLIWH